MAWKDYDSNSDSNEGGSARFNAGIAKSQRLHKVTDQINEARLNPQAFNVTYSTFNFKLWLESVNSKLSEIKPKLSPREKDNCENLKRAIEFCMEKYPIQAKRKDGTMEWQEQNWRILRKYFEIYEDLVNCYSNKHKFDMPEEDESALF